MTLNGQLVILRQNLVRTWHPMGWRSGFRRKLFGNLQSYAYTVTGKKCSPASTVDYVKCSAACTGDIRVMELFTGITEQEASNQ